MVQRTLTDFGAACQNLMRAPLFSLFVCALLAIGLGANTLVYSLVDKLLLRPLAVEKPWQLLRLGVQFSPVYTGYDHPYIFSSVLRDRAKSFSDVFVSWPLEMALNDGRKVESVSAETVSGNYFSAFGLKPKEGRLLSAEDERTDAPVAVLSQHLSQRIFGSRNPLGSTIRLRGNQFTVVGVLGGAFSGTDLEQRTDVWLTMAAGKLWFTKHDNTHAASHIFVRLREGVTSQDAVQEVQALYPALVDADAATRSVTETFDLLRKKVLKPLLESAAQGTASMRKTFRVSIGLLMGSVAALLLLVCANVVGLMIVRAQALQRDTAIRLSIGATPLSLLRQKIFEMFLLSSFGTTGGWALACLAAPLLVHFLPQRRPIAFDLAPDFRVFLFASLACGLTAIAISFLFAVHQVRVEPGVIFGKGGGRTTSRQVGRGLVAFQVALSTVLLLGALSFLQTLDRIRAQDPGFRRHNLIVLTVNPRMAGVMSEQIPQVFDKLVARIKNLPDVQLVALADQPLMRGIGMKSTIGIPGSQLLLKDHLNTSVNDVTPSYFATLGMRLVEGRQLRDSDAALKPAPVVVNKSFARRFFPGTSALDKTFGFAGKDNIATASFRVVGIVNDARYRTMRESPPTYFGILNREEIAYSDGEALHIATEGDPSHVMQATRKILGSIGTGLAPTEMATMEQEIETSLWQERLLFTLASAFAGISVLLAGLGMFGMLAFAVSRRSREIGIRIAVGASRAGIAQLVIRDAASSVLPGVAVGLAMYAIVSKSLLPFLFGVVPWNLLTAGSTIAIVLAVATLSAFLPAVKAVSIEPMKALRQD